MILEEYYKRFLFPSLIVNGAKIMSMEIDKFKFIDSLNFLPMSLAALGKSFGITELKKGFFPHFFNTEDNQDYQGPIPAQEFFDPDGMSAKRREEFLRWYQVQVAAGENYDFQEQLLSYCQSDVQLLRLSCESFMTEFEEIVGANPMESRITIASACNMAFRMNWMAENKIAVEPFHGWRPKHVHSKVSIEWLLYCERQLQQRTDSRSVSATPYIQHAGNAGEKRLTRGREVFLVDGYEERTETVYEFQGCFYHGCPSCFPNRNQVHVRHEPLTMKDVWERTRDKIDRLKAHGFTVKEMWECEWRRLKEEDEQVKAFTDSLEIIPALDPREGFFGGRTNATCLARKAEPDEQILYDDIMSLYPFINKNSEYPVGHPTFIDHPNTTDITKFFGLAKVKVLPPKGLYHPVLPSRHGDKLTFPLCRTCLQQEQPKSMHERIWSCAHTREERALTGTWCTPELLKALQKGYEILYIYEVWHFRQRSTNLFTQYINTFLKLKVEASGWPSHVGDDPAKRQRFIDQFLMKEGIALDPDKIEKNEGKRALAKLMLNSFWGKFGQRPNMTKCAQFSSASEFFNFLNDDSAVVSHLQLINEDIIEAFFNNKKSCDEAQVNVNIFVACFTTCMARLELYSALDLLKERALYFDTDSVVYTWKEGQPMVPRGNFLGNFEPELQEGDDIREFVSAGPKNYAYTTRQGKQVCKVRGFTLNTRGAAVLHFDSMKTVIADVVSKENVDSSLVLHNPHKLVRNKALKKIQTVEQSKKYRLVFDKRVLDAETYLSYPYGYDKKETPTVSHETGLDVGEGSEWENPFACHEAESAIELYKIHIQTRKDLIQKLKTFRNKVLRCSCTSQSPDNCPAQLLVQLYKREVE